MSNDTRLPICPENLHVGTLLGPIFYIVTPGQTRTFANAVATAPASSAEIGQTIASPTMRLPDYALLIAEHFKGGNGGVHAKHWCEFHEPMRVGQAVKTTGAITEAFRKRGKFYFTLEYESRDVDTDRLLVRQAITSVLINQQGTLS